MSDDDDPKEECGNISHGQVNSSAAPDSLPAGPKASMAPLLRREPSTRRVSFADMAGPSPTKDAAFAESDFSRSTSELIGRFRMRHYSDVPEANADSFEKEARDVVNPNKNLIPDTSSNIPAVSGTHDGPVSPSSTDSRSASDDQSRGIFERFGTFSSDEGDQSRTSVRTVASICNSEETVALFGRKNCPACPLRPYSPASLPFQYSGLVGFKSRSTRLRTPASLKQRFQRAQGTSGSPKTPSEGGTFAMHESAVATDDINISGDPAPTVSTAQNHSPPLLAIPLRGNKERRWALSNFESNSLEKPRVFPDSEKKATWKVLRWRKKIEMAAPIHDRQPNRYVILGLALLITTSTGSFFFNWPMTQALIVYSGAFSWLCRSDVHGDISAHTAELFPPGLLDATVLERNQVDVAGASLFAVDRVNANEEFETTAFSAEASQTYSISPGSTIVAASDVEPPNGKLMEELTGNDEARPVDNSLLLRSSSLRSYDDSTGATTILPANESLHKPQNKMKRVPPELLDAQTFGTIPFLINPSSGLDGKFYGGGPLEISAEGAFPVIRREPTDEALLLSFLPLMLSPWDRAGSDASPFSGTPSKPINKPPLAHQARDVSLLIRELNRRVNRKLQAALTAASEQKYDSEPSLLRALITDGSGSDTPNWQIREEERSTSARSDAAATNVPAQPEDEDWDRMMIPLDQVRLVLAEHNDSERPLLVGSAESFLLDAYISGIPGILGQRSVESASTESFAEKDSLLRKNDEQIPANLGIFPPQKFNKDNEDQRGQKIMEIAPLRSTEPWDPLVFTEPKNGHSAMEHYAPSVCVRQIQRINALMPVGVASWFLFSLVGGLLCDVCGPRLTAIAGLLLSSSGWGLLAHCSEAFPFYNTAFALIGCGVDAIFIGVLTVVTLFPGYKGTVVSMFNAARSLAFGVPIVLRGAIDYGRMSFSKVCLIYCGFIVFWAFIVYLMLPSSVRGFTKPPRDSTIMKLRSSSKIVEEGDSFCAGSVSAAGPVITTADHCAKEKQLAWSSTPSQEGAPAQKNLQIDALRQGTDGGLQNPSDGPIISKLMVDTNPVSGSAALPELSVDGMQRSEGIPGRQLWYLGGSSSTLAPESEGFQSSSVLVPTPSQGGSTLDSIQSPNAADKNGEMNYNVRKLALEMKLPEPRPNPLQNSVSSDARPTLRERMRETLRLIKSDSFYLVVPLAVLTIIRGSFLSNSAADQLGPYLKAFSLLTPLSFLPAPLFGFLADKFSIHLVFVLLNTLGLIQFIVLCFLSHLPAFLGVIAGLNPFVSSFFLGQFYCYVTVTFPAMYAGTLVGLTISIGGIFGLVITPMYDYAIEHHTFHLMNLVCLWSCLLCYPLIYLLYQAHCRDTQTKLGSGSAVGRDLISKAPILCDVSSPRRNDGKRPSI